MPKISIILPAYRPQYLDACVASALAQTFGDFELLIGDDCPGDDVARVLAKWSDPRIRYTRNPSRGVPASNRDMLLGQATGDYIKFLFDDDLLMPRSVEVLCAVAEETGAKLAFHANHLIDEAGIMYTPPPTPIPDGGAGMLEREQFFGASIRPADNFIGGPVNILIAADALRSMPQPFGLDGNRMRFLTDMALYTNIADMGLKLVGLGGRFSAFRSHPGQASSADSPIHAAGVFEWEYLARWAADRWAIGYSDSVETIRARHIWYADYLPVHPQLQRFIDLGTEPDDSGRFCHDAFRRVLEDCWALIDDSRGLVSGAAARVQEGESTTS